MLQRACEQRNPGESFAFGRHMKMMSLFGSKAGEGRPEHSSRIPADALDIVRPPERSPEFHGGRMSQQRQLGDTPNQSHVQEQVQQQTISEMKRMLTSLVENLDRRPSAPAPPIYIQNNLNSEQLVKQEVQQTEPHVALRPSFWDSSSEFLSKFFGSSFNRFCLFTSCGIGLCIVYGHYQHKWRMAEMQKRIDANFFLRMTQVLLSEGGGSRR